MRMFRSLWAQMLVAMAIVALMPLAGILVFVTPVVEDLFRQDALHDARLAGVVAQKVIEDRGQRLFDSAQAVSRAPLVRQATLAHDRSALLALPWFHPGDLAPDSQMVVVVDNQGTVLASSPDAEAYGDNLVGSLKGLQRALAGQPGYSTEIDGSTGVLAIRGFAPITAAQHTIGAVIVTDVLDQALLASVRETVGLDVFMLLPDGTVLGTAVDDTVLAAIRRNSQDFSDLVNAQGHQQAMYAWSVASLDDRALAWIGVVRPANELESAQARFNQAKLGAGVAAMLSAVILAWILSRLLARPLEQLAQAARSIAEGERRAIPHLERSDEVASLSRALATMVTTLNDRADQLAMAGERTQRIIETVVDGIVLVDRNGRITYVNPAAERILGASQDLLTERSIRDGSWAFTTSGGEPFPEVLALFAQLFETGEPVSGLDVAVQRLDGTRRSLTVNAAPLRASSGQFGEVVASFGDTSERQRALEALRESEALKRAILDTALDAIITIREDGTIVEFNRTAEQVFGYDRTQVLGHAMDELIISPSLRAGHLSGLARYLATGVGTMLGRRVEVSAMRADGTEFPIELAIAPMLSGGRRTFTAFIRDLTERKRAEADHVQLVREQAARAEADENRRRTEVLYRATKQVREHLDLEHVLATVLEAARQLFAADRAAVYCESEPGSYLCLASFGLSAAYIDTVCRQFKLTPIGSEAIATRRPTLVEDMAAHPPSDRVLAQAIVDEGIQANLVLPLLSQGEVVGTLSIYHNRPRWYAVEELQVAQALADQAAVAIEQARLYHKLEERAQEVEALLGATKQITASLDMGVTLENVLDSALALSTSDLAIVRLLSADGATLVFQTARGRAAGASQQRSFRLGEGLVGTVAQTGLLLNVPDAQHDPRWAHVAELDWVRSALVMPLRRGARVIGTLGAYSAEPSHFTANRERLLTDLAEPAALAIERAWEVAERQQMAESLSEANEMLRALIDASPVAINVIDLEWNVRLWSRASETLYGWTEEEVLGRPLPVVPGDQDGDHVALRERMLAGEVVRGLEARRCRRDGSPINVSLSAALLRDASGRPSGIVSLVADMTEHKRAEEQLRLQSAALEAASDAIFITDRDGRIVWVNPAFTTMTGYTLDEAVGHTPRLLKSDQHDDDYYQRLWATISAGRVWRGEMVDRRKDGSLYAAEQTITPVRNQQGEIHHFVSIKQDITERRRLEEQLRQAQKMEAVGQLAGGVAHDFNNLLTVINGFSELVLLQLDEASPLHDPVQEIAKAGESALAVTRQLLAFSRRQVTELRVLDLNAVLTNMETMLRRLIREDIELVMSLEPAIESVKCDPGQIEQVTMNLVVNARDAMPTGGKLVIKTANTALDETYARAHVGVQRGPYVMLAVADTGVGMDAVTLARIFEPFFTTKEKGRGTGLGLSVVYGIVQQAGGHVEVESEPGRGTTFSIYLPQAQASPEPTRAGESATGLLPGSGTVLVVEDDEQVRSIVRQVLGANGYTVLEASNGEKAIKTAVQYAEPIHLLLTDVVMPKLGGRELVRRLVALRPEMKTLYMSGYADDDVLRQDVMESEVPLLPKPFTPTALVQKVHEVLGAV